MKKVIDVQAAVVLAAGQALLAKCGGTFGVGGALLDAHGNVLQTMQNRVIADGSLLDPTAHSERRLVDWYFAQRAAGADLPPPHDITVVTSVDPCCMCAGALLAAGFHVVVASNDINAGANYDLTAQFPALPAGLAAQAADSFSYPEVIGGSSYARAASGAPLRSFFIGKTIAEQTLALTALVFDATATPIKQLIHSDVRREDLLDPRTLPDDHAVVRGLRAIDRDALRYVCARPHAPDAGLAPFLLAAMATDRQLGGDGDACALLDAFGNLLLCVPGALSASPVRTAYMACVRAYSGLRHRLRLDGVPQLEQYLAHPKHGTLLMARGPGLDAASFMNLGAYGSTMEGELPPENPRQLQFVAARIAGDELERLCLALPPLYRNVIKVMPSQVDDSALIAALA